MRRAAIRDPLAVGAAAAFAVAGLAWLIHPWVPVEDLAIIELEIRRVTSHPPLAGAYSSLPFDHPGPAMFLVLWAPYELFGERSSALLAGTLWLNGAVAALALATARRLGGHLHAAMLGAGVAVWSLSDSRPLLLQPWNPYLGALPMVALVLLTWAMVERRAWALPLAVVLASWMTQAHIQFGPVALALTLGGGLTLGALALRSGSAGARRSLLRAGLLAVVLGVVMWTPVIIDVASHGGDSNPALVAEHYRHNDEPAIPRGEVVRIARSELSMTPTWAGGPLPYRVYDFPGASLFPALVPIAALVLLAAWRRQAWSEVRGIAVAGGALGVALLSLSGITGAIGPWYLIAAEGASITLAAAVATSAVRSASHLVRLHRLGPRADRWQPAARWTLTASAMVLLCVALSNLRQPYGEEVTAGVAEEVLPDLEARIGSAPVLIEARSGFGGWLQAALALQLDRAGHRTFATTTLDGKFPADMEAPPPEDTVRFVVVTDPPDSIVWRDGVEVVEDLSYPLSEGAMPLRVVIVQAPLGLGFISAQGPSASDAEPTGSN